MSISLRFGSEDGKVGKVRSCSPISPISLVPLVYWILDFGFWILDLDCVPAIAAGFWIVDCSLATGLLEKSLFSPLHDFMDVVIGATLIG